MTSQDRRSTHRSPGALPTYGLLLFALALLAGAMFLRAQGANSDRVTAAPTTSADAARSAAGSAAASSAPIDPSPPVTVPSTRSESALAFPEACSTQPFPPRQCDAIIDDAMDAAGLGPGDIAAVEFLPFERIRTLGGGQIALVRLHLAGGTTIDQAVSCVGISFRPACNEVAEIQVHDGVSSDVPCWGEPPDGCATPPPTPDAAAVADASPYLRDAIDIQIDRKGPYEVRLGSATLPNGYLQERSFRIGHPQPTSYWIDTGVFLDVRPDVPGRPWVGDIYREPFDGPEPVSLFLVFEVNHLEAPSVLDIRDVVVR